MAAVMHRIALSAALFSICAWAFPAGMVWASQSGGCPPYELEPSWSADSAFTTYALAFGDVDRDGDLDLVCANGMDPVALYFNSDGRLATRPAWLSESGLAVQAVALGDMDGDGDLDLACGSYGLPDLVFLNGSGRFQNTPYWTSDDSLNTTCVALADIDDDGTLDIVCGCHSQRNTIYFDVISGPSAPASWRSSPAYRTTSVDVGDVDGDGDIDLVFGNYGDGNTLYSNDLKQGGGIDTFPSWTSEAGDSTCGIALGDIDADGLIDIVCGNDTQADLVYMQADGGYPVTPSWISAAELMTLAVALGDVDCDGYLDLICTSGEGNSTVYTNSGTGFSSAPQCTLVTPEAAPACVSLVDIDGDGDLEAVFGDSQSVFLYENKLSPFGHAPDWESDDLEITRSVALGDIDGNGLLDLVCGNQEDPDRLYLNSAGEFAQTASWSSSIADSTWVVVLADCDLDGELDLISGKHNRGNRLYLNDGASFGMASWVSPMPPPGEFKETWDLALGDIDANGYPDLVCGNVYWSTNLYLAHGGGDGVFSTEPDWRPSSPSFLTSSVAVGDVDQDGDPDLVCGNMGVQPEIFLNMNGMLSETSIAFGVNQQVLAINLANIDGDEYPDIVCGVDGANCLYVNRDGGFASSPDWVSSTLYKTSGIAVGDVNGDGYADLAFSNGWAPVPNTVYINEAGILQETPAWSSDQLDYTWGLALGDVDNDGDLDLVCGNTGANRLYQGRRNPVFKGDPLDPRCRLPNNPAFLRDLRLTLTGPNTYVLSFEAVDVESDPLWVISQYQRLGIPLWGPLELDGYDGPLGPPLSSSPIGVAHEFTWDVASFPLNLGEVAIRIRTVSAPRKVAHIQHSPCYTLAVGSLAITRPEIQLPGDSLLFHRVTVGDTATVRLWLRNAGTDVLEVTQVDAEPDEMWSDTPLPLSIDPHDSMAVKIHLFSKWFGEISGDIRITSSDPFHPEVTIGAYAFMIPIKFSWHPLAPAVAPLGEPLAVVVEPAEDVRLERGTLYYRSASTGGAFNQIALAAAGDGLTATIPGPKVTEGGLQLYLNVTNDGIRVTDPPGAPVDSVYFQAVAAPESVRAMPVSDIVGVGEAVTVAVYLQTGTMFRDGVLHYRKGGESAYARATLGVTGGLPSAGIPGTMVSARGLEYWVSVRTLTDSLSDPADDPQLTPNVIRVEVDDLTESTAFPGNLYRMVSIPLDFGQGFAGRLDSLLSDQPEFGGYNKTKWRCLRWLPQVTPDTTYDPGPGGYRRYDELTTLLYPAEFIPVPGRAWWLICAEESRISTPPVVGYSTQTQSPCRIQLTHGWNGDGRGGWNMIGNPFTFPVAWASCIVDSLPMTGALGLLVEEPIRYLPDSSSYEEVAVLEPFEGYWVWAKQNSVLKIPAIEAPPETVVKSRGPGMKTGTASPAAWEVGIIASCRSTRDVANTVGVSPSACSDWDPCDRHEPPMSPDRGISLYFPHMGWKGHQGYYTRDIRGEPGLVTAAAVSGKLAAPALWGYTWAFDVAKNFSTGEGGDEVRLEFTGLEALPPDAAAYLVDRDLGKVIDLRANSPGTIHIAERGFVVEDQARFILLIGSRDFIDTNDLPGPPGRMALRANRPNPFSTSTLIRYDVSESAEVRIRIYTTTGALVRDLVSDRLEVGRYEVVWDCSNDAGRRVSSGVYFCKMQAGSYSHAHRMVVMR